MDLTLYKKVLNAESIPESFIENTANRVNEMFANSPSYRKMLVDDVEIDVIFNYGKKHGEAHALLRPKEKWTKGLYGNVDEDVYMVTEHTSNKIYPKAKLELCNSEILWEGKNKKLHRYKCIVRGKTYEESDDRTVVVSKAELTLLIQYNDDTKEISPRQRFSIDGLSFEVVSIDSISNVYKGEGFIEIEIKSISKIKEDESGEDGSGWGEW